MLLEARANPNFVPCGISSTALHAAANRLTAPLAVVEALVLARSDVNRKDAEGETPLHVAAWNEKPDVVQLLVAAGGDALAPR